jgi:hypothetical protein
VGCIGILKDWLLRAVSTALDDGLTRLSLDCVQDHALPVDIYRQMALDAYEGEQRLNHTASNREHVWRLLQGGELIAPVPPLPPRENPPQPISVPQSPVMHQPAESLPAPETQASTAPDLPSPVVKKTRSRKKVEAPQPPPEPGSTVQASPEETEVAPKLARGRRKKAAEPPVETAEAEGKSPTSMGDNAPSMPNDPETVVAPTKPKRTRRVGEPKLKRYPVGEQVTEQGE